MLALDDYVVVTDFLRRRGGVRHLVFTVEMFQENVILSI